MNRSRRTLPIGAALFVAPVHAETLRDAVVAAYATNSTLASAHARQDALSEETEQARAGGRLTASADAAGGYDKFDYGKGVGGAVSVALPIWTGGRVPAAIHAAEGDIAAGAQNVRDSEAALVTNVVGAYAELPYDQQTVGIAKADIALLDHQVAEAQARFKLGQATKTDVAQLVAQRASVVATLADAQATLDTTQAGYAMARPSDTIRARSRRRPKHRRTCPERSTRRAAGRSPTTHSSRRACAPPTRPPRGSTRRGPTARRASA